MLIEAGDPQLVPALTATAVDRRRHGALPSGAEIVAGVCTVLIDGVDDPASLRAQIAGWALVDAGSAAGGVVEIPVVYDGPDLADVAAHWGMTRAEARRTHATLDFTVAFVGFAPGFAYLSGLPAELAVPRLARPRERVPAGSVAVADRYGAVYPLATPGGWRLLGTTTTVLWDLHREPPALLTAGSRVRFVDVTEARAGRRNVPHRAACAEADVGGIRGTRAPADVADAAERRSGHQFASHRAAAVLEGTGGRTVTVMRAGALSTLQDRGRVRYRHLAVATAGALDADAAALANRLVGNAPECAVIETTLDGVTLRFDLPAHVAVTGADCAVTVDGRPAGRTVAVAVRAGQTLDVGAAIAGVRSYVAVAGGWEVEPVLGSCSYDTLAGIGPPPLAAGDVIAIGAPTVPPALDTVPVRPLAGAVEVPVGVGPRRDWLSTAAIERLSSTAWSVTPSSNRIALRLAGPPLHRIETAELPTEGLVAGAVQIPPDGQPVVFLADHPTTGGYPVVAIVPAASRSCLAQLRPGDTVRFRRAGPGWETGSR